MPCGERRDQATTKPSELLELLTKTHFRYTVFPFTTGITTKDVGTGGCFAGKKQKRRDQCFMQISATNQ